jgi:hypothetical protein
MMRRKNNRARLVGFVGYASGILAFAAVACTNDFDAYQAGAGDGSTSPEGSTSEGGGSTGTDGATSKGDAAVTPPVDAALPGTGMDAGCAAAAKCTATDTTCKSDCDAQLASCNQDCGNGGGGTQNCKSQCKSDRDKCASDCTTTCRACAGAGCSAACN